MLLCDFIICLIIACIGYELTICWDLMICFILCIDHQLYFKYHVVVYLFTFCCCNEYVGQLGIKTDAFSDQTREEIVQSLREKDCAPVFLSDVEAEGHYHHFCKEVRLSFFNSIFILCIFYSSELFIDPGSLADHALHST
jgi:hypothetical protein